MSKTAKIAKGKPAAVKVVRECRIVQEGDSFVAYDVRTRQRVTKGDTYERCRHHAGFRHSYAVVS